jgi:leader peptidase (prepilin peptidase)/N-methyltransferase
MVEATTGLLFAIWVFRFPETGMGNTISGAIFLSFLVLLSAADLKWFLLPHTMNDLFVAGGLLSFWLKRDGWGSQSFLDSLFGFMVFGTFFLCVERFWPAHLGGGDIKMMAGLGAWLGLENGFEALTIAFALGAFVGTGKWMMGMAQWKSKLPFGPFLATGGCLAVFLPKGILVWNG